MKKMALGFLLLFALEAEAQENKKPLRGFAFVLDPAHGGLDTMQVARRCLPGSNSGWMLQEHNISAYFVRRLGERLAEFGAYVVPTLVEPADLGLTYYPRAKSAWPDSITRFVVDSTLVERTRAGLRNRVMVGNSVAVKYGSAKTAFISPHVQWSGNGCRGSFIIYPQYGGVPPLARHLGNVLRERGLLRKQKAGGRCKPFLRNSRGEMEDRVLRVLRNDESIVPNRFVWEMVDILDDRDFVRFSSLLEFEQFVDEMVDVAVTAFLRWARHP